MMYKKAFLVLGLGAGLAWVWWRLRAEGNLIQTNVDEQTQGVFLGVANQVISGDFDSFISFDGADIVNPNAGRFVSNSFVNYIKKAEGFRAKAYFASIEEAKKNSYTIGYGHVILGNEIYPFKLDKNSVLTEIQATGLLLNDLAKDAYLGGARAVKIELPQSVFDAIVDFCYQAGLGNFKASFNSTARRLGLNPLKAFNELGIEAGVNEMTRYMDLFSVNRKDRAGQLARGAIRANMAINGVY